MVLDMFSPLSPLADPASLCSGRTPWGPHVAPAPIWYLMVHSLHFSQPQARQQLFSSPSGKGGDGSSQLPVTAVSSAVAPPALRAPQQPEAAALRSSSLGGGASISSSMRNTADIVQLSKLPASPIRPVLGASPVRASAVAAKADRTTWKSQAAVGPPPDLIWSPTVERLIMNSTKQVRGPAAAGAFLPSSNSGCQ